MPVTAFSPRATAGPWPPLAREATRAGAGWLGRTALGLVVREVLRFLLRHVGGHVFRRLAGATPVTALAFFLAEQALITVHWARGRLAPGAYGARTAYNVGSTSGALIGALILGGVLTLALPLIGTTLGTLGGGVAGSLVGGALVQAAWSALRAR